MTKILLICFLLLSVLLSAQKISIDKNVAVTLPGKPIVSEEIINGFKAQSIVLNSEDSFVVVKTESQNKDFEIPKSVSELKSIYQKFSANFIKTCNSKGLKTKSLKFIKKGKFLFYEIEFIDGISQKQNGKAEVLFANGVVYIFIYSKINSFSNQRLNNFFSSVQINENISQLKGDSNKTYLFLKIFLFIILIIIIGIYLKRNKASS